MIQSLETVTLAVTAVMAELPMFTVTPDAKVRLLTWKCCCS